MKTHLPVKTGIVFVLALACVCLKAQTVTDVFDKTAFYTAMAGDDSKKVKVQLAMLDTASFPHKNAFEGAMLMKKASVTGGPFNKLSNFKAGHRKLEAAISGDEKNAEFRFLRLMIQENAPRFLGYDEEMKKDSAFISENVKTLDPLVQQAVMDYSKKSKFLKVDPGG